MRLIDRVAQSTEPLLVALPDGQTFELPGTAMLALSVCDTSLRYVLANDVSRNCRDITTRWPDLLGSHNSQLHLPAGRFWVEWSNDERNCQVGALTEVDESGRAGRSTIFWSGADGPEVAQGRFHFDLDHRVTTDGATNFPLRHESLRAARLEGHVSFKFDDPWIAYFKRTTAGSSGVCEVARVCSENLLRDFYLILAFAALLGGRSNFDERQVDRAKLNKSRVRAGAPMLLDHIELSLAVGRGQGRIYDDASSEGGRTNPRLHLVRGHLVRRNGQVFWRSTHLRGDASRPAALTRTYRVRMAPSHGHSGGSAALREFLPHQI